MRKNNTCLLIALSIICSAFLAGCSAGSIETVDRAVTYPITSIEFPNDCSTFTCIDIDTVQELYVSDDNPAYSSVDGVVFTKDLKTLVAFPLGRTGSYSIPDGTEKVGAKAFAGSRIEEIYIPDSVTEIGSEAFAECMSLNDISFPQ